MLGVNSARALHLQNALTQYEKLNTGKLAIDTFLKIYFRVNRLSQNSRSWIAEHMYEVQRWKGLIAYVSRKPLTWTNMLNAYLVQNRWRNLTCNKSIAPHIRCSFPEQLFSLIEDEYGLDKALEMCNILNEEPITFVRVNTFRMSREKAYKFLIHKGLPVEKCIHSACGLIVSDRKRLLEAPEYRAGVVEIQDEGSQVVGNMVEVSASQLVGEQTK